METKHKIIAVTPAGRKRYLKILSRYILADNSIHEWHLWDNCRSEDDRIFLNGLARESSKVKVIKVEGADGTNKYIISFLWHKNKGEYKILPFGN